MSHGPKFITLLLGCVASEVNVVETDVDRSNAMLHLRHHYHVLSYPGSGRTWLRSLLHGLGIRTGASHGEPVHSHPFSVFPHQLAEQIQKGIINAPFSKAVLLLRDPVDVLVSNYHERRFRAAANPSIPHYKISDSMTLDQYARDTLSRGGFETLLVWLVNWVHAANLFKDAASVHDESAGGVVGPDTVVMISYEVLKQCPHLVLNYLVNEKWKLNIPCHLIRRAIANNTLDHAKNSSDSNYAAVDATKPYSRKVRSGSSHMGHQKLSRSTYQHLRQIMSEILDPAVHQAFYSQFRVCYVLGGEEPLTSDIHCRR